MRWNLDDLPVFVAVVDRGGITAAADALGLAKSTVSTTLARLEASLGLRLVDRTSRALRVTPEGETLYARAQLILDLGRETEALMTGLAARPAGRLAVALPPAFAQEIVAPRLAGFRAAFPDVVFDITITSHGIDLLRDRVDVAVVVGPLDDSEFIARTLRSGRLVWVTSPGYLAAHEIGPAASDVAGHVQVCEKRYGLARVPVHIDGVAGRIDLDHGVTHINDPLSVRRAVLAGAGVSVLPEHYCREALAEGALVEVAPHITFDSTASKLTVVYPSRRLMSPTLRAFLDFLDDAWR